MVWAWLEAVPLSTMGSRRASAVREWQGMRQKASAVPDSRAAAAMVAADLIIVEVVIVFVRLLFLRGYCGSGSKSEG
jgi:hypothetical protein